MADVVAASLFKPGNVNGQSELEARLRSLSARQLALRARLEATREELNGVTAELLRIQDECSASPEQEEEYWQCWKRIEGSDPRDILQEIEEARKNPQSMADFLAELERAGE